jgi:dTDP-4-amino-4,6-dideoxygalactose transaminase
MIPFNKPYLTGKETHYIYDAVNSGKLSGNGKYTNKCHEFFEKRYGFGKCLLTSSCTDALEMAAILVDIQPGDEIIMPSYTFVSTANAFILRGARVIFVDSRQDYPGMDEDAIESLITERTKAIVPVHYGGVACDMDKIMDIANRHHLFVIEDAAQAIDNYFTGKDGSGRALGSIGHLATFSFHETKNVISGEGGMLVINDMSLAERSEIIWDKGTDRSAFFRGEVDKYGWIDIGSSFLPSELIAAFLWAQLENLDTIQQRRISLWNRYHTGLAEWAIENEIMTPFLPGYSSCNGHLYYLACKSEHQRDNLIRYLKSNGILSVFHYQSLHKSKYYALKHDGRPLPYSDHYSDCLLRLPLFHSLSDPEIETIIQTIISSDV